ncbi:hypothetical protein BH09ACT8_BH09ACT8_31000 [soil metagenome]
MSDLSDAPARGAPTPASSARAPGGLLGQFGFGLVEAQGIEAAAGELGQ